MERPSITDPEGVATYLYAAIILAGLFLLFLIYVGFF
jgi:hypothetical protein